VKARAWIEDQVKQVDVVLPLVAIATPATYVSNPISVFELDFEANLLSCVIAEVQKTPHIPVHIRSNGMSTDLPYDKKTAILLPVQSINSAGFTLAANR